MITAKCFVSSESAVAVAAAGASAAGATFCKAASGGGVRGRSLLFVQPIVLTRDYSISTSAGEGSQADTDKRRLLAAVERKAGERRGNKLIDQRLPADLRATFALDNWISKSTRARFYLISCTQGKKSRASDCKTLASDHNLLSARYRCNYIANRHANCRIAASCDAARAITLKLGLCLCAVLAPEPVQLQLQRRRRHSVQLERDGRIKWQQPHSQRKSGRCAPTV